MSVLTIILAGGQGKGLSILSAQRSKTVLPFGGKYRIIDFVLSNAVNSKLDRIAVLAQSNFLSLMEHLGKVHSWYPSQEPPVSIQIWQASLERTGYEKYRGTADALYQNNKFITDADRGTVLILAADQIYRQNYQDLLHFHQQKGADLTIAVKNILLDEAHRFGMMDVDDNLRIKKFVEKPKQTDSIVGSLGIYVFNTTYLLSQLEKDAQDDSSAHDFGMNIIPHIVESGRAYAYPFTGYWSDINTIETYWKTNLALLGEEPSIELHEPQSMIHTHSEEKPPVKVGPTGKVIDSLIADGCVIHGEVVHSVLSSGVRIEKGAIVHDSVVMSNTIIRTGAAVNCCVLDEEIEIDANAQIGVGNDNTPNQSEPDNLYTGITIVGKRAHIPENSVIGRNCRIDANTIPDDFKNGKIPGGSTISHAGL